MSKRKSENYYYVTAIDGARVYFVCGPFETKQAAENCVPAVREYASRKDGRADFMGWGVSRTDYRRLNCPLRWGDSGVEVVPASEFH